MTEERPISAEQERIWRRYYLMQAQLMGELNRELTRTSGLSAAEYEVMVALWEADRNTLRARDLRWALAWEKSRLSHQLRRMEQRGFVVRDDCAEDSRGAVITLTRAGLKSIKTAECARMNAVRKHFVGVVSDDQLRTLGELSETVLANLEAACSRQRELIESEAS